MGKNLIVKNSDFSQNGFKYNFIEVEHNDLRRHDGTVINQEDWPVTTKQGEYYYAGKNNNVFVRGLNLANSVYNITNLTDGVSYVRIKTMCNTGYISDNVAGLILFAFINSSERIISGFASSEQQSEIGENSPLIAVGRTPFETIVPVPDGAVKVLTCYSCLGIGLSPFDNNYKLSFLFLE